MSNLRKKPRPTAFFIPFFCLFVVFRVGSFSLVSRVRHVRNPIYLSAVDGEPQVLRFRDPVTQCKVVLVGAMHYNPKSIRTAARVVKETSVNGNLGAVVLETCPERWEASLSLHPRGSFLRKVLDNEMQSAAEQAQDAGRPVILGDASNEVTSRRMRDVGDVVRDDLSTPQSGGWVRFASKIFTGEILPAEETKQQQKVLGCEEAEEAAAAASHPSNRRRGDDWTAEQESEGGFLTLRDALDATLLLYLLVSFARYLAAIGLKTQNSVRLPFFGWLSFLCFKIWTTAGDEGAWTALSALETSELFAVGLFVCLVARVYATILLDERDQILAENISSQLDANAREWGEDCTVVAVVGMAHCNGIKRAIRSREITNCSTRRNAINAGDGWSKRIKDAATEL